MDSRAKEISDQNVAGVMNRSRRQSSEPPVRIKCPFHTRNPCAHQRASCAHSEYPDLSKLKNHLHRVHKNAPGCECCGPFRDKDQECPRLAPVIENLNFNGSRYRELSSWYAKWELFCSEIFPGEPAPLPYPRPMEDQAAMNSEDEKTFRRLLNEKIDQKLGTDVAKSLGFDQIYRECKVQMRGSTPAHPPSGLQASRSSDVADSSLPLSNIALIDDEHLQSSSGYGQSAYVRSERPGPRSSDRKRGDRTFDDTQMTDVSRQATQNRTRKSDSARQTTALPGQNVNYGIATLDTVPQIRPLLGGPGLVPIPAPPGLVFSPEHQYQHGASHRYHARVSNIPPPARTSNVLPGYNHRLPNTQRPAQDPNRSSASRYDSQEEMTSSRDRTLRTDPHGHAGYTDGFAFHDRSTDGGLNDDIWNGFN